MGRKRSLEHKANISASMIGKNNPMFGKPHSEETKAKISATQGTAVQVFDKETNETTTFSSIRQAAKELSTSDTTIRNYIKNQKHYKGRYQFEIK
jgi:group I intron endonuclease